MSDSENGKLIIEGGTIFNSIKGELVLDTSVIIEGKTIKWVGPSSSIDKNQEDTVINAEEKYILPGLRLSHPVLGRVQWRCWNTGVCRLG